MGRIEAEIDGIEHYYDENVSCRGSLGSWVYIVPCERCGKKFKSISYGRNRHYVCKACRYGEKHNRKAFVDALTKTLYTKEEQRFDRAVDNIKKQVKNFKKYDHAIESARRAINKYGSIPEAMAAIELIMLGYPIIPQQRVGRYHVDFFLPKDRIVIEVDGSLYHKDPFGGNREATIQLSLGLDVKIVHVPAETIARDITMLEKIMKKIKEQ